jgi:hypothetical protein
MMKLRRFRRKWPWPNQGSILTFVGGKSQKIWVRIANFLAKI